MKIELMSRSGEFGKYGLYEDGYAMEWAKRVSGKDHNEDTMRLCFEKLMEARKIIADIVNQYH